MTFRNAFTLGCALVLIPTVLWNLDTATREHTEPANPDLSCIVEQMKVVNGALEDIERSLVREQ